MNDNETFGGELGPPPEKTAEKWECPLLCGKTYRSGVLAETVNDHLLTHVGTEYY